MQSKKSFIASAKLKSEFAKINSSVGEDLNQIVFAIEDYQKKEKTKTRRLNTKLKISRRLISRQ